MRLILTALLLGFLCVGATAAPENDRVTQVRGSIGSIGGGGTSQPVAPKAIGNKYGGHRHQLKSKGQGIVAKPKPYPPGYRPVFGRTFCCDYVRREETVIIVQPPETPPEPPVEEVEVTPPPPPDPRGPRFERARGPGRFVSSYSVGDRVPTGEPLVALNWRRFDLPEPAVGTGYYRVGREVLVLDLFTREIVEVATPG